MTPRTKAPHSIHDNGASGASDTVTLSLFDSPPATDNPWEYLHAMRGLDLSVRQPLLQPWLDLVSKQPPHQRDALLSEGREIWKYRMETARAHLREMQAAEGGLSATQVFLSTDDLLAETIFQPRTEQAARYLVHRFSRPDDSPEIVDHLTVGKTVYSPPTSKLMELGAVLFPSGSEEYGSDYDLFVRLRHFFKQYVQLDSNAFGTLICCYVLMTWLYDRFEAVPYLRAQGSFGSGKSRLIQAVGTICYRPTLANGATTESPVFRIIDGYRGTLVLDEMDFSHRNPMWETYLKVLLAGYQKGFPVLRAERGEGDSTFHVGAYDVFCPKILSTRNRFSDEALESRCFSHTMPVLADHEIGKNMPLVLGQQFRADAQRLRNMLLTWRFRHYSTAFVDPIARVVGAEARVNQIIQPLLACATDPRIREEIMKTVQEYSANLRGERRESLEGQVVAALVKTWVRKGAPQRMLMKGVTQELREEHDQATITDRKVGDVLRRVLKVETRPTGGMNYVYLTEAKARELCLQTGVPLEDYRATGVSLP